MARGYPFTIPALLLLSVVASASAQETGSSFGGGSFHDPPPTTPRRTGSSSGGGSTGSEIHRSPPYVDEARHERERAWREEQSHLARERAEAGLPALLGEA